MKNIIRYAVGGILLTALAVSFPSCKKTLIEKNTNPETLSDIQPEYLFAGATDNYDFTGRQQLINRYTFMQYMQYIVPDVEASSGISSAYWSMGATSGPAPSVSYYMDYFSGVGMAMNRIISLINNIADPTQKASYANLKAICQIVNTYEAWRVVDVYGAIPYAQAFLPSQYSLPQYQGDFELYKTFDSSLRAAVTILNGSQNGQVNLGLEDFFYGGNIANWASFANTLRIEIALRYENRDKVNLTSVLNDIAQNFNSQIISSNAQSFGVNNDQNWNNNLDDINALIVNYDAAYPFVEFLKSTNDPRLRLLVRQNDWGTNSAAYNTIQAQGTPSTLATLDSTAINTSRYWGKHATPISAGDPAYGWQGGQRSQTFNLTTGSTTPLLFLSFIQSRYFLKNGGFGGIGVTNAGLVPHTDEVINSNPSAIKMRTLFLSYAETCFMMAELAEKGYNGLGKTAASWYNAGIAASLQQYESVGVTTAVPGADSSAGNISTVLATYMAQPGIQYRGGTLGLQQIYTQAWIHMMTNPEQAWAMWKRTGFPSFATYTPGQPFNPNANATGIAYLETLQSGSGNMIIPRRPAFLITDAGSQLNQTNFNAAVKIMQSKDAAWGATGNDAIGRIWWDNLGE